jgi:alpha-D-ribose 1-methylphosphonate 5-triphosphate synthase subunit PhnL
MARPSTIDTLPDDILEKLQELLRDPRVTQLDVTARISAALIERGEEPISKSAVNRYSKKMDQVGERLRQSRAVAEMWIGKLGATPQGQMGHLINEILRTLAFDMSMSLQDEAVAAVNAEDRAGVIDMLKNLSLSVVRLERAASENVKREAEIRKQAKAQAAEAVEAEAKRQGASAATIDSLRQAIMSELAG